MTQIYLKDETRETLKRIKKERPDFNLSSFIQESLKNHLGLGTEDLDKLYKKISDNKTQIEFLENENIYINNKIESLLNSEKVRIEKEKSEKEQKALIKRMEEFILTLSEEKKAEYLKGLKEGSWKSVVEYSKIKLGITD